MDPVAAFTRLGGVGRAGEVLGLTTRRRLRRAVRRGSVLRLARGRYCVPTARDAHVAAAALGGVVALRSAGAHHGWALKEQPPVPEVAVRPDRSIDAERRAGVRLLWTGLSEDQVESGVTPRCARCWTAPATCRSTRRSRSPTPPCGGGL